jgi:hypothetical protein
MQTVVLYGKSLVVSSIGASLQDCAGIQVLPVDPAMPDAGDSLSESQADVVIFDLEAAQPDFALTLWKKQPQLLLIGVDLAKGQALLLSSQPARVLTTGDLLQVIESHVGDKPEPPGPPGRSRISK